MLTSEPARVGNPRAIGKTIADVKCADLAATVCCCAA